MTLRLRQLRLSVSIRNFSDSLSHLLSSRVTIQVDLFEQQRSRAFEICQLCQQRKSMSLTEQRRPKADTRQRPENCEVACSLHWRKKPTDQDSMDYQKFTSLVHPSAQLLTVHRVKHTCWQNISMVYQNSMKRSWYAEPMAPSTLLTL